AIPSAQSEDSIATCTGHEGVPFSLPQSEVIADCSRLLQDITYIPTEHFNQPINVPLLWKSGHDEPPPHEARPSKWHHRLCIMLVVPRSRRNPDNQDSFTMSTVLMAGHQILNQCTEKHPIEAGYAVVGPRRKWVVFLEYSHQQQLSNNKTLATVTYSEPWDPPPALIDPLLISR
ncbi:MAG: hypothetical protein Q9214_007478, partial [Letrouitia sp. 1 TL-2023]